MSRRTVLLAFLIFLTYAVETSVSQVQEPQHVDPSWIDGRIHGPTAVQPGQVQQEELTKFREIRQEEIRRDTEKLYQLSTELREYIEKNNGNFLSLDMIKKADTIEHLAHSVKKKMKDIQ
jgi:hypothetical protein